MATVVYTPCAYCGEAGERPHPYTCSRCQDVKYCSKDHQLQHWKEAHGAECRGAGGKTPTLAEQVADLRAAMQTHAERTQRLSEAIMKAGAERERIIQDVSEATAIVMEVAREKDRAEQEVATAQSELKAKSREIEMCLTLIGGHYEHGYEEDPEWGCPPALTASQSAALAEALADRGWAVVEGFIDMNAVGRMRSLWMDRYHSGEANFQRGRMGGGRSGQNMKYVEESSRGDFVRWLSPEDDDCPISYKWLRAGMDGIVQNLVRNERCPALEGVDTVVAQSSMIAVYPGIGSDNSVARYIRHIDNPIDDGRILTVMVYLNPDSWEMSSHGGALRVFHTAEDGSEVATDICPKGGRLLVFLSDRVPHEVLPVTGDLDRLAITTWYMDFAARARATSDGPNSEETEKLRNEIVRMGGHSVHDHSVAT